jgi:hypothetical protein
MSVISLRLPDYLHDAIRELAIRERVTINQLLTLAAAEKVAALMTDDYLRERAQRGNRAAFERVMAKIPATEPEPVDRIREEEAVYTFRRHSPKENRPAFDEIWQRVLKHQDEDFRLKRGGVFRYFVQGETLVTDRDNASVAKSQFEQAYAVVPLTNVAAVPQQLWGRSYIYAILMDDRIRQNNW